MSAKVIAAVIIVGLVVLGVGGAAVITEGGVGDMESEEPIEPTNGTENKQAVENTSTATNQYNHSPTRTRTKTKIQTAVPTDTPVVTESPNTRVPDSDNKEDSKNKSRLRRIRYDQFMSIYNSTLSDNKMRVIDYTIDAPNQSSTISWVEKPSHSDDHIENRQISIIVYAMSVENIRGSENTSEKLIPKKIIFEAYSPTGELYISTHIDYVDALRYNRESISVFEYQAIYIDNSEYGPAHPEYEGNETATATAVSS